MGLSDGEVAALASQVAGLIESWLPDKPAVTVRIDPVGGDDPYRWTDATGWTVSLDLGPGPDDTVAVRVSADNGSVWALHQLIDALAAVSETDRYRALAFPPCLTGHTHPARVDLEDEAVVLRCPETDEVVQRISPELA